MDIKNEILWRIYLVLLIIIISAIAIFVKTAKIQIAEGDYWKAKADSLYLEYRPVNAARGNIFASNGSLLATSLPTFEIRMDLKTEFLTNEIFNENVDTLAKSLANLKDSPFTPGGYKDLLNEARKNGERYLLIKKDVTYPELKKIAQFPLFELGRFKGGFIEIRKQVRKRPFGQLARRTIGYVNSEGKMVGLEGAFNDVLAGEQGKQLMQKVSGGKWIPVEDITAIEPKSGQDIKTTIDPNIQDIAENALKRGLTYHNARHGSAIIMEVSTGKIKAIANLGKTKAGDYKEIYNYAIGESTEPGSTFKTAAMLALLEDGYIDVNDTIDLQMGRMSFSEEEMVDASYHALEKTSIQKAFEISSNVGIAQLVVDNYQMRKRSARFIKRLKDFNLHQPTGIEISGEGAPFIKEFDSKSWSGISLPWISIGYESKLTPLQMLTFYNAIANKGRLMKPYLVSDVEEFGVGTQHFRPTVVKRTIASERAIEKMTKLLIGVVERGTAKSIHTHAYKIAGKTGTTILNYKANLPKGYRKYQASFVGFFPADKPKYSCIVVVNTPRENGFYGGSVSAPIFREIADKCFAMDVDMHQAINKDKPKAMIAQHLPKVKKGAQKDIETSLAYLKLPFENDSELDWAVVSNAKDTLQITGRKMNSNIIPDIRGMGLKDALHILGNLGLNIKVSGFGQVATQSILPGTKAKGQTIKLTLN